MRCQSSIWRWSPFFGICASKFSGASGCTTKGANVVASAPGCDAMNFCQCASAPSPRQETMPIPVIQASRGASAIRQRLAARQADRLGALAHLDRESRIGKFGHAERDGGVANGLAVAGDARLGHCVAGAFVHHFCFGDEFLSGTDEGAQLGLLYGRQEWHALELMRR